MVAPFLAEEDFVAAFFLAPPDEADFDAVDFLAVLEADFFAPDLEAVDFFAVLDVDFFAPDFEPLDDFDPADFFAVELPLLAPVEVFLAPPVLDFDVDELDFFFAPVPELFVEDVDFFVPPDLAEPDLAVDLDAEPPDLEDDPDFDVDDFDEVEPVFFPEEVPRRAEPLVAASPSETIASPAPCSAPAAAPAAALAITSPAVAAAAEITLPAASFVFCTNPFLFEPFLAAILLFLLDVCTQYTALPYCKSCAETRKPSSPQGQG